jgi:hypothetical protein
MWRRQTAPRNLQLSRSFDQVLGRLRPQGQPMPSPTLGRRLGAPTLLGAESGCGPAENRSGRLRSPWHHGDTALRAAAATL